LAPVDGAPTRDDNYPPALLEFLTDPHIKSSSCEGSGKIFRDSLIRVWRRSMTAGRRSL